MAKDKNYFKDLTEKVCMFYVRNRNACLEQYNKAEDPDVFDLYETICDEKEKRMLFSQTSIVVLTANKYEKNMLHIHLSEHENQKIKRLSIKLFPQHESHRDTYAYFFKWKGYSILHIEAQKTGSYTMGGAADIVRFVFNDPCLYPTVIISLGVCFGIDENNQSLGDTIISEKVYPYFMGAKWDEKSYVVSDDNMFSIKSGLYAKIQSEVIHTNVFKSFNYYVDFGNYITGEAVISNKDIRDMFANITPQKISAGEMEGYGVFKECWAFNYNLPCLIIKSICDWGVIKNFADVNYAQEILKKNTIDTEELSIIKDALQAYASSHACSVFGTLIEKHIFNNSIYSQLYAKIKQTSKNEYSIFKKTIQEYANQIARKRLDAMTISEPFINSCIESMILDHFLLPLNGEDCSTDCNQDAWSIHIDAL